MRQWETEFRNKQKFVDKTCETKGVHESQSCQSVDDKYKVEIKRCFMKSEYDHVRPYMRWRSGIIKRLWISSCNVWGVFCPVI